MMSLTFLLDNRRKIRPFHDINHRARSFFSPFMPNYGIDNHLSFSLNTNIKNRAIDCHPVTHSTINIEIPATTTTVTPSPASSSNAVDNKRIMIVDDEQDIARFFKVALERAGFIVDVFNDPMESLSKYKVGAYSLLLLDVKMPRMNGFELYDRIKQIDDKVKVCFITAFEEYYDEFKRLFPYLQEKECFIRKPIGIQDLIRSVESQLKYN